MRDTNRLTASCSHHPIWVALTRYSIGPADAAMPFVERLARENGWTVAHAERVVDEYKRFCFLAATVDHEVGLAVALFGTSVLVGSGWADFHRLRGGNGDGGGGYGG